MAKGLLAALKGIDAFGKTSDDVKVRTRTGAFITLISAAIIFSVTMMEWMDYRKITMDTSILVDKSRGEKITVHMNLTFPRVPCFLLSVDIMDISGELQRDVSHNVFKFRLDQNGNPIPNSYIGNLENEVEKFHASKKDGYCGSCYGGVEPPSGCCNTCDEVRQAYVNRGWSFAEPDLIEQCRNEHWTDTLHEQADEGCNVSGRIRVNKVIGNIQFSPGRAYQANTRNYYELVPYLKDDANRHDFSHTVHQWQFESDDEYDYFKGETSRALKKRLGTAVNPLDDVTGRTSKAQYMFQYFLKVVSTEFRTLQEQKITTNQYSMTHFERDLTEGANGNTPGGIHVQHGVSGLPGAFFNYEISPILIVHTETRQSFAHFLTSTCAIVGGVLTVASIVDSVLFATGRALKKSVAGTSSGFSGKMM